MAPKRKAEQKEPVVNETKSKAFISVRLSDFGESEDLFVTPRYVSLSLVLMGENPNPGDALFLAIFNGQVVLDGKWQNGLTLESSTLALNLKEINSHAIIADKPLLFIFRTLGGKPSKDSDPLLNTENKAGATVDLFPLLLGEEEVCATVPLLSILTGERFGCSVNVRAISLGRSENTRVPLLLTLISAHCLPPVKDGTAYLSAISLNGVAEPAAVNFGMSLSTQDAKKVVWAAVSTASYAANSALNVPNEDKYVPDDFEPSDSVNCNSAYWNAMKRVLVDPLQFHERLTEPFLIEVAGVPKAGKLDVRGRYMGFIDAGVLLQPGIMGLTTCTKLLFFTETGLPENCKPVLEFPPMSAKISARDTDLIKDEHGHSTYVVLRFDLQEPLLPRTKLTELYEIIEISPPEGCLAPKDDLDVESPPEDPTIDVRRVRKEGGALAVQKELSGLACRGAVPMNQGIKRTAANRLLMRVRSMLKQFPPGDCSYIDWQDTVTGQHAACRRAVTASFAPQPPPLRTPPRVAAARCRAAGDSRIADKHMEIKLKVAPGQPWALLSKTLRCLEERSDSEAKMYLLEALRAQPRNRYLLWTYAGMEFDKGPGAIVAASGALRIAVKGDYSDGTTQAIGWAALHALYHYDKQQYAAFVAAKKMRKSYDLLREWKKIIDRWIDASGEEESFWLPSVVTPDNPMLIAAAFFLCLRCYKFSETILQCVETGCATRGDRRGNKTKVTPDIYYLRAASLILRRQLDAAMDTIDKGIKRFGPSPVMSQMRSSCLLFARGWDGECNMALKEAERAGAEISPSVLLQAALGSLRTNPQSALQRAARAHKMAPSAHSALTIARVYAVLQEYYLAERWASAAVKFEPLLADGWAFLALLAMYERNKDVARTMLRTAMQVGPISPDIEEEVRKTSEVIQLDTLPDYLMKNLCFCEYLT